LSYGIISDEISKELGFYRPLTVSWGSRDYYFGKFHTLALQELMKTFNFSLSEIPDGSFKYHIASRISDSELKIHEAKARGDDKKTLKRLENIKNNLGNKILSAALLFRLKPSLIDLLASIDSPTLVKGWNEAVEDAIVEIDEIGYKIKKDVIHPTRFLHELKYDDILTYYKQIESIEVE
jgi:hypothetical protein